MGQNPGFPLESRQPKKDAIVALPNKLKYAADKLKLKSSH
jgi:hypothetical protein